MNIEILYFASIRECLGLGSEQLKLPEQVSEIAALIDYLAETRGVSWSNVLHQENLLIAVNQTMVKTTHMLKEGDEVAFFPPVSGG